MMKIGREIKTCPSCNTDGNVSSTDPFPSGVSGICMDQTFSYKNHLYCKGCDISFTIEVHSKNGYDYSLQGPKLGTSGGAGILHHAERI